MERMRAVFYLFLTIRLVFVSHAMIFQLHCECISMMSLAIVNIYLDVSPTLVNAYPCAYAVHISLRRSVEQRPVIRRTILY